MDRSAVVDWEYSGPPDLAVGTGATSAERALVWGSGLAGGAAVAVAWYLGVWPWAWWQYLIVGLIALDIAGGVVANATNSCKRFYHTPSGPESTAAERFFKRGMTFDVLHVYPIVVALVLPGGSAGIGVAWYVALIGSAAAVRATPLYLKRPVAFLLIGVAVVVSTYALPPAPGVEWLMPLLFLKIVYGHGVQEEPYRPIPQAR